VRRLVEAIQTEFARQHPEFKVRPLDGDLVFKELGTDNAQVGLDNRLIDLIGGGAAATAVNFFGRPIRMTGRTSTGALLRSWAARPLKPSRRCPSSSDGSHPASNPTVTDPTR
jgi:hypothetical protein